METSYASRIFVDNAIPDVEKIKDINCDCMLFGVSKRCLVCTPFSFPEPPFLLVTWSGHYVMPFKKNAWPWKRGGLYTGSDRKGWFRSLVCTCAINAKNLRVNLRETSTSFGHLDGSRDSIHPPSHVTLFLRGDFRKSR